MRTFVPAVVSLFALLCIGASALAANYVGQKFPEFSATDPITKQKFSLDDFKGQVVLVDFWATWCGPCVKELPNVKSVFEQYKDDGLVVISISLDSDDAKFKSFVKSRGMPWHHVMDGGGWKTRLAQKYGINSIPKMFLIDHTGTCISDSARGSSLGPAIERAIKKMEEAAPAAKPTHEKSEKTNSATNEASYDQWRADLAQVNGQLLASSKPLIDLGGQMERLADADLSKSIPPIRRQAFMMGILNDEWVRIPQKSVSPELQKADLITARDRLQSAITNAQNEITGMSTKVAEIQKQLEDESLAADKAKQAVDQTLTEAGEFIKDRSPSWQNQLASLDGVIARLSQQDNALLKSIDAAEKTLGDIRYRMASKPDAEGAKSRLNTLRGELLAIREVKNIPATIAVIPPEATASDVDASIKATGNTIVQLRQFVSKQAKSSAAFRDKFVGKVKELQKDLVAAPSKDSKWMDGVQQRFTALCDELLNAWDQL